jgi:LuxR family maltose regulon positive regulatory protein
MAYAWALIAARQLELARYWVEDVQQSLDQLDKQIGGAQSPEGRGISAGDVKITAMDIRGGLAVCQSILAILNGNLKQAAEFTQQATRYLPKENVYMRSLLALQETISCVLSGDTQKAIGVSRSTMRIARQANNPFVMIVAANELAIMQMMQGQLSKSWETIQKAKYLAVGPDGKPHPLSGFFDIVLGEILMERDLLKEARDYLERGCQAIQSVWYLGSLGGMVSLARVCQGMGDISGTQAVIEETARMAQSSEAGEWDASLAAALAVRLAVQRDDLVTAEKWWIKGGFPDLNTPIALEAYPYHIYEYILLAQIRYLLVRGLETGGVDDIRQAVEMLEPLLPTARGLHRGLSQIQILILLAMAQSALGEERAAETLMHALTLGEPEGFRRCYLDEGWRLADLLRHCRSAQEEAGSHFPSLGFIDSLLESINLVGVEKQAELKLIKGRAGPTTTRMEDGLPISLSAREMEVLVLIAEGKSNQEISAQLYLALNTVKRHVYNIFAKLQVKKRTQAVSKARQLGLIP